MSRGRQDPVVIGVEFDMGELPMEFQHAVKFAAKHDRIVMVGYIDDEQKVYLLTVPHPAA